jgi:HK97 family phage prohead protease
MEHKSFAVRDFKALGGDAPAGSFEAVVAVFGNVDAVGDRMVKGAFADSLSKGMPPVVWSHDWDTPPIGTVDQAEETDEGLHVKGRLFVGPDEDHAVARQVHAAMRAGALKEFSFGYKPVDYADVEEKGAKVRELRGVELYEVGPTLKGVNPATRLVGVKAAGLPGEHVDRVLSQQNFDRLAQAEELVHDGRVGNDRAKLAQAESLIEDVLSQVDPTYGDPTEDTTETRSAPQGAAKDSTDKPSPKPPSGEEAKARIAALLLARPHHVPQEG